MKKKYPTRFVVEDVLSFWASFGVEYLILRYIFGIGHWAAVVAYALAGLGVPLARLKRELLSR